MFNTSELATRLDNHLVGLLSARSLCAYAQVAAPEAEGFIVQISQRLQGVIGGLSEEVAQLKAQGDPFDESLMQWLSVEERGDLMSLNKCCSDLGTARHLLERFRRRLIDLAGHRRDAGDVRGSRS